MSDDVVERVAVVISRVRFGDGWSGTWRDRIDECKPEARAALAALKVGDEVLPSHFVTELTAEGAVEAVRNLQRQEARRAAEEMRERCIEIVQFEMLAGSIKDRTLERLRALSVEPNNE